MIKVYKINNVHAHLVLSEPNSLVICAMGSVSSSGWTHARFVPWIYIHPPADGIYDFDLVASPPEGPSLQVILPIAAAIALPEPPSGMKGVRIHGSANHVEALVDPQSNHLFADAGLKISGNGLPVAGGHQASSGLPWPGVYFTK